MDHLSGSNEMVEVPVRKWIGEDTKQQVKGFEINKSYMFIHTDSKIYYADLLT
jgi:hypothetical protein